MKDKRTNQAANTGQHHFAEIGQQIEKQAQEVYHLAQVVKLAAFSAEARRTLKAISNACLLNGQLADEPAQCVEAVNNWGTFEDVTGEVLRGLGASLEDVVMRAEKVAIQAKGFGADEAAKT